jgi:predicted AAA+ superfamily ATPase
MIRRPDLLSAVLSALRDYPVAAIAGPRQCGKTTLARAAARAFDGPVHHFDLENPADLARLSAPNLALGDLRGLVVLDEIQRMPSLYEFLRVLADRPRKPARFLVLGSAAPELVRGASESLAGRIRTVEMTGFDLAETGVARMNLLWLRGGFPRSFLAANEKTSMDWRESFIRTFLERDIPQLGISIPSAALRRFWTMVAHYHGQLWNAAEFARAMGTSEPTARRYLDILTGSYVVRQLQPWHTNTGKRQIRAPKVYIRDAGLLHTLLGLPGRRDLYSHPKFGASWEGFAIEQIVAAVPSAQPYFWGTHGGAELDLLLVSGNRKIGVEFKATDAPGVTKSMRAALADLNPDRLLIVHLGQESWRLDEKIEAVTLPDAIKLLRGPGVLSGRGPRVRGAGASGADSDSSGDTDP